MSARRTVAGLVLALVAPLALAGCSDDSPSTGDKGYVDGEGIITRLPADERKELGLFEGETVDGDPISLDDVDGTVTVVNVWYATCPPCRKEAPILAEVATALEGEVDFVGINNRDSDPSQARGFERTFDVPYPTIFDPSGRSLLAFAGTLPPSAVPSTVIIDAQGRVAASVIGAVSSARTLRGLIEDVQDEAPS